ncbi:MAG: hypothetical protein IK144_11870 [Bacteroidaceae bacterium]|nr:hypothetical protein [Bacteroidaceae bacterium]
MENLSKAEEKRLVICRERAFDLLYRMEELVVILRKKEWPAAEKLLAQQVCVSNTYKLLEKIEHNQYVRKHGNTK